MSKKNRILLILNFLIVVSFCVYVNSRLKEALNLSQLSKLRQGELTSKEQILVSINQMNETGFAINSVTILTIVLFIINCLYLKYYSNTKHWLLKSIFFLFITFGVSILHIMFIVKTNN